MEVFEGGDRVDEVVRGKDVDFVDSVFVVIIILIIRLYINWCYFFGDLGLGF